MSPYVLATLISTLGLGTMIALSSSHWLLAWMCLEINTLAIIPLMAQHPHPRAVESATKYFIAQAAGAATILFAALTNSWVSGSWHIPEMWHPLPCTMCILGLALKMGIAPLHSWMPEVMQGLSLKTALILATWQKLAPFCILLQVPPSNPALLMALGITSILVGGWGGFNQTQVRKVLAYSSIAHLGWMVLILQFSPSLALLSLFIYFIITTATFLLLDTSKATNINLLATAWSKTPALYAIAPLVLLSLGGLPPLTGFIPKWLILKELTEESLFVAATFAALGALISLFFYLRLAYAVILIILPHTIIAIAPWRIKRPKVYLLGAICVILSLVLLPFTPLLTALFSW
uniref:NADH-ubiquinone oxidoreductase chain 2 n=1 Tax=Gerres filamentosus TaxID=274467 RepID=A0A343WSM9_9TELE|nr:NADH dehydrogenase subunit 2 [Gerres filamentosus]